MNDQPREPSAGSLWLTVIVVIGGFLLFVGILYLFYFPVRETAAVTTPVFSAAEMAEIEKLPPEEREARLSELRWERRIPTPEERKNRLLELRATETAALTSYTWIDQENGVVRIPIDEAMELMVQDLQRARGAR